MIQINRNAELLKNTIIIFIGKFCTQFISLLLIPLYTRYLITSDYGYVDLIQTYISLLVPVLILRLDSSIFRYLIDERNNKKESSKIITTTLFLIIIQLLLFTVVAIICNGIFDIQYFIAIIVNTIAIALSSIFLQLVRGLGKNIDYAIASIITGVITLICNIILLIGLNCGGISILISSIIANIFCIVYLIIRGKIYKYIKRENISKYKLKEMLRYSIPMIPDGLSWWIINVSDRTIISTLINTAANGIYSVSSKFSNILSSLYQIFNMSWQESASIHINDEDKENFFTGVLNNTYKIFYSICLLLLLLMPFVFDILIGADYSSAKNYIPILLLSNLFNALANVIGGIYIAKKNTKSVSKTTLMAAVLNILLNIIFIKYIGLWAASLSTLASCLLLFIYRMIDVKKYMKLDFNYKLCFITLSIFAVGSMGYYYNNFILNFINLLLGITLTIYINKNNIQYILKKALKNIKK